MRVLLVIAAGACLAATAPVGRASAAMAVPARGAAPPVAAGLVRADWDGRPYYWHHHWRHEWRDHWHPYWQPYWHHHWHRWDRPYGYGG
jgi:hypothetical protein